MKEYIEKFCASQNKTPAEAVKCIQVRLVGHHYGLTDDEIDAYGCIPFA